LGEKEGRVIYVSLIVVAALGVMEHLTAGQIYSIVALFLIVIVALGNIYYLYTRFKKSTD
jgi:heme A synthase